ncbi:hypothetical protein TELCIR_12694 [Teladorsagia circumcincta]|uniref:Uncharacterized protein n=1 Tax=Teladorsagia circumcincta TaxID=45464 RepID=A0A2G9U620_TELCI|nr:hypothetical protein TELCIR_12694 [Teladorsagia circumcincta]
MENGWPVVDPGIVIRALLLFLDVAMLFQYCQLYPKLQDPSSKRPLPIIPQMQNNMLTHQQLMQQAALQAAMQARTLPTTMQNSYLTTPPHLRPLDNAAQQPLRPLDGPPQLRPLDGAQQIRQMDQNAAAAAAYNNAAAAAQQYRAHDQAMAQQLQRQLPPQMLQNQALQMRNQQMTVQEYHNLLRLAQPAGMPQRRQTIAGTNMSPQAYFAISGHSAGKS